MPQPPELESAAPALARGSPRAQAAAALVGALGKAARAFTLYDAGNALVRQFIGEYRSSGRRRHRQRGRGLEVQPFEMGLGPEVVYREDDRERSLAFKLFRDGVRN